MNQKFLNNLFKEIPLSDKTKAVYIGNLSYLINKKEIKNLNFLSDPEKIFEKLTSKSLITKRNYLISICKALSLIKRTPKLESTYLIYKKQLLELNGKIKSNTASSTTVKNWLSLKEINIQLNKYKKLFQKLNEKKILNSNEYDCLINGLVLFLYTLIPPRRTNDYQSMLVINNTDGLSNTDSNLLVLDEKQFIFKNYKTKKIYGDQIIDIPTDLLKYILIYLKFYPNKIGHSQLFLKQNGNSYQSNDFIHSRLSSVFNKNIGSTQMRRVYLTSKYKPRQDELKKDALEMGTSPSVINSNYIKQNLD